MQRQKPVIGLIGGIGAGKTLVAELLSRGGGKVISGDALGHEALRQPAILAAIRRLFAGHDILAADGQVDRKKLGDLVFAQAAERVKLEHLVHPYIARRLGEEIAAAAADERVKYIVVDAAIMLEAGWADACDRLIFIDAPRELRRARVQASRGWSDADLSRREAAQMPLDQKKLRADAVIDNGGSAEQTRQQVDDLLRRWNLAP